MHIERDTVLQLLPSLQMFSINSDTFSIILLINQNSMFLLFNH